jgi:hypothetical protein
MVGGWQLYHTALSEKFSKMFCNRTTAWRSALTLFASVQAVNAVTVEVAVASAFSKCCLTIYEWNAFGALFCRQQRERQK